MMRRECVSCLIAAVIAAVGSTSLPQTGTPREERGVIDRQAIERMNVSTAYDVLATRLNRLPSRALRGGATSFEPPQEPMVMIDGNHSEVAALRTLPARDIQEIRILNAGEGTQRYGTGAANGVIVITTRK
ncbi:MAG: TonB-dependent receptor plug domain-containing protein [Gemmatimonadota bacterium]